MLKAAKILTVIDIVLEILYGIILILAVSVAGDEYAGDVGGMVALAILYLLISVIVLCCCVGGMNREDRSVATGVLLFIFGEKIAGIFYFVWFAHAGSEHSSEEYRPVYSQASPYHYEQKKEEPVKKCPYCDCNVDVKDVFCTHCGADLIGKKSMNKITG